MKKTGRILILVLLCIIGISVGNNRHIFAKSKKIGSFQFIYKIDANSKVRIQKVKICNAKRITKLVIPSKLDGKPVYKLCSEQEEPVGADNLFGIYVDDENSNFVPQKIIKQTAKIKKIVLPDTIVDISEYCFMGLQDGKSINIPKGLRKNVEYICKDVKWKKFKVSGKNKKYKVQNGVLLSKNGKTMYTTVRPLKKLSIPKSVTKIENLYGSCCYSKDTVEIYIPKTLTQDDIGCLFASNHYVKFNISPKNKKYGIANGCIYNKKNKHLVVGVTKNDTFVVPKEIKYLNRVHFAAKRVKKMVIPASVKEVANVNATGEYHVKEYCFLSKKPPVLSRFEMSSQTFCVPKGTKQTYKKAMEKFKKYDLDLKIVEK